MSDGFLGMDIGAMTTLKTNLHTRAEEIGTLMQALNSEITGAVNNTWKGSDAQQFSNDWSNHMRNLQLVKEALETASSNVQRNIQDQQTASGA